MEFIDWFFIGMFSIIAIVIITWLIFSISESICNYRLMKMQMKMLAKQNSNGTDKKQGDS